MITVEGKDVFTELSELVDPAHTALLLIDMQHDFVDAGGLFVSLGVDLSMYETSLPRLVTLLDEARRASVRVIHIQNTALPNRMSDSPAQIRFNLRMHERQRRESAPLR
ncbi:MAG: cysteine hydrolase family protein, partial [Candidatus Dormiibacterota bacterium]